MTNVPEDELFSAYLDGEMTAEEKARVERLLVSEPSARPFLDELRALSTTLQSLRTEKVGVDLSDAVLRTAERRMLADSPRAASRGIGPLFAAWSEVARRIAANPRVIVWSGLAVVVALMLALTAPDGGRHNEIAGDPTAAEPDPRPPAEMRASEPERPGSELAANQAETPGSATATRETPKSSERVSGPEPKPSRSPVEQLPSAMASAPSVNPATAEMDAPATTGPPEAAIVAKPQPEEPSSTAESVDKAQQGEQRVILVRCDALNESAQEELSKILAEKQIAFRSRPVSPQGENGSGPPGAKTIWIEADASPSQVEAAVAQIRARSRAFASVKVQSLAGDAALAWLPKGSSESVVAPRPPDGSSADSVETSALAAQEADRGPTASSPGRDTAIPLRFRIGSSVVKTVPKTKKSQVHFDRGPDPAEKTETDAEPADPSPNSMQPEQDSPNSASKSAERRRVVFVLNVDGAGKSSQPPDAEQTGKSKQ